MTTQDLNTPAHKELKALCERTAAIVGDGHYVTKGDADRKQELQAQLGVSWDWAVRKWFMLEYCADEKVWYKPVYNAVYLDA